MTSKNMLSFAGSVLRFHTETRSPVVLLGDFTYKISTEDWGLATLGLANKHNDAHTRLPASEAVPLCVAWGPKESASTWAACLITVVELVRVKLNIRLEEVLQGVMLDGTTGGEAAVRRVMPKLPLLRDLRHTMAAVKRLPGSFGDTALRDWLSGEVQFTAALPPLLFHAVWQALLADMVLTQHTALATYTSEHLLQWNVEDREPVYYCAFFIPLSLGVSLHAVSCLQESRWTAAWRCGVGSIAAPGHTTQTAFQALERHNGCLKQGLPDGYHRLSMLDVSSRVWSSLRALHKKRGWVNEREEVSFQAGEVRPATVNTRLLCGDWLQSDRLEWQQDGTCANTFICMAFQSASRWV